MNRWLGAEIYLIHFGHGLLYLGVLAIVALHVPWSTMTKEWARIWVFTLGSNVYVGYIFLFKQLLISFYFFFYIFLFI